MIQLSLISLIFIVFLSALSTGIEVARRRSLYFKISFSLITIGVLGILLPTKK
ncbi:hypothetical protein SAMN04487897_13123 [Paenibacillus sp. yr247]|nr:hypothetical protein SAMN04487897_13123 [Paenibacillus sp. yr247]